MSESKSRKDNPAFTTFVVLALILLVYLAVRFAFVPPGPRGTFHRVDLRILGKLKVPQGAGLVEVGKDRYYLPGLKVVLDLPEVPLRIEKKDREILVLPSGEIDVRLSDLSVMRLPRTMNIKVSFRSGEYRRSAVSLPPMPCTVELDDIVLRSRRRDTTEYRAPRKGS